MLATMILRASILVPLLSASLALAAGAAVAKDAAKTSAQPLPGVDDGYSIVKPQPEPDDALPAAPGQFRIGDMDVRISGFVQADIGFGKVPPPHR